LLADVRGRFDQRADDDAGDIFIRRRSVQSFTERHCHEPELRDRLERNHVIAREEARVDGDDIHLRNPFEHLVGEPLLARARRDG
jgi:hypothetical protein